MERVIPKLPPQIRSPDSNKSSPQDRDRLGYLQRRRRAAKISCSSSIRPPIGLMFRCFGRMSNKNEQQMQEVAFKNTSTTERAAAPAALECSSARMRPKADRCQLQCRSKTAGGGDLHRAFESSPSLTRLVRALLDHRSVQTWTLLTQVVG